MVSCLDSWIKDEIKSLKMVAIPSGYFWMGAPQSCRIYNNSMERPQHLVHVAAFFMSQTLITQSQWRAVANLPQEKIELNPNPSLFKGDNLPVESVSWHEAMEFCARLSRLTQQNYRLPSEAEWEYACRAYSLEKTTLEQWNTHYYFPFNFGTTIYTHLANYQTENKSNPDYFGDECKEQGTANVNTFPPNAFGLHDMHGNVCEWCADPWYPSYNYAPNIGIVWDEKIKKDDNRYYNVHKNLDILLSDQRGRVYRGGSFWDGPISCRSAYRWHHHPTATGKFIGFRVVL